MTGKFVLKGLNKPWKAGGFKTMYATVDLPNEDWFHAIINMPEDRTSALWNWLTSENERFEGKMCTVEYDGMSTGGVPINPVVKDVFEVPVKEWHGYFDYSKYPSWHKRNPELY